jgi:mRNA-decapping enzyme subunit 2
MPGPNGTMPTFSDVFEDLSSRFVMNLPDAQLDSFERLFFQLEQAHWFYDDFYSDKFAHLPKLRLKNFCFQFFQRHASLQPHIGSFEQHFSRFSNYLGKVPVCGGIILSPDQTKCLLVRGYNCRSWNFPRGKLNENETLSDCAVREIQEEVGFDASNLINKDIYLQCKLKNKKVRLYIIPNVNTNTYFQTETRKEIDEIKWWNVSELLTIRKFFYIRPFAVALQRWIKITKKSRKSRRRGSVQRSLSRPMPVRPVHPHAQLRQAHSFTPPPPSSTKGRSSSPLIRYEDSSNDMRQQSPPLVGLEESGKQGWSAEEMFRINEKMYGVKSTVPDNDVVYPENADEIFARYLGPNHNRRYKKNSARHSNKQNNKQNNTKQNKNRKQKRSRAPKIVKTAPPQSQAQPSTAEVWQSIGQIPATKNHLLEFRFDTASLMHALNAHQVY